MTTAEIIRKKLDKGLNPVQLEIIDESHLHVGHSGSPKGGESHFRVVIVSNAFEGVSRIDRQRIIYKILASELEGLVHALSVSSYTPSEVETDIP